MSPLADRVTPGAALAAIRWLEQAGSSRPSCFNRAVVHTLVMHCKDTGGWLSGWWPRMRTSSHVDNEVASVAGGLGGASHSREARTLPACAVA